MQCAVCYTVLQRSMIVIWHAMNLKEKSRKRKLNFVGETSFHKHSKFPLLFEIFGFFAVHTFRGCVVAAVCIQRFFRRHAPLAEWALFYQLSSKNCNDRISINFINFPERIISFESTCLYEIILPVRSTVF
ncbi:hypothetical protein Tcan_04594 [Toxocara canis]|uniref:Uncharacterized protein n=1 Tax=Toxocara canis TaxID=6265 RepID=A0A0B2V719_TOXCA|nr:hypothetical protein Tcan_04594 [Toxocara canis]